METVRMLLRPWQESDAETLFKYASDPDVGPRAGWAPHKSVEESLEIIRTVFNAEGMWAVIWKETGQPIGCVGYLPASASNLKIAEDECEVGYWIARPFWGNGICTEALRMVIDYCFNEKGFSVLWGSYFPSNPASGRVMEKCGAASTIKEFYLLPVGGKLVQYDGIAVNTIVMNKEGEVSSCDIRYTEDLNEFNRQYLEHTAQVAATCQDRDLSDDCMVIGTSAIVDTEIDGAVGMNSGIFNNPFLIWGRYKKKWLRYELPISFQFHHTQMDGAHAGKFLANLQIEINNII